VFSAAAGRSVIAPIGFDHATVTVHVSRARPVAQGMVRAILVAALWHHVEKAVDPKELFSTAAVCRIGVEDLALVVLLKNAVPGEVLQSDRPLGGGLEIVDGSVLSGRLGPEGDIEVEIEIAAVG
jgi:hypothetical protein